MLLTKPTCCSQEQKEQERLIAAEEEKEKESEKEREREREREREKGRRCCCAIVGPPGRYKKKPINPPKNKIKITIKRIEVEREGDGAAPSSGRLVVQNKMAREAG